MQNMDEILQNSLYIAQNEAATMGHSQLTPLHLFWGLIENPNTVTHQRFSHAKDVVKAELDKLPKVSNVSLAHIQPDLRLQEWLVSATSEAAKKNERVGEMHVIPLMNKYVSVLKNISPKTDDKETSVPTFLINLNELAKAGKLDPVIGRKSEIRAMIEILGRRSKNNPILVGPAGVGKTAVVEGLAEAIVRDDVPPVLKNKIVYSLDLGALTAGTKYRGDFEERVQKLLKFLKEKKGEVILFIDEIHQLIGAGRTDGAMDAANLLKPALARGDLYCVGATTPEEFQKYIQNDSALERRFRQVPVNEPTPEDSIEILMGLKDKFEVHHGIKISEEAIIKAVFLSKQYVTDKQLPDKAIDLIDEAASSLKLSAQSMPAKLVDMEKELKAKKIQMHYSKEESLNENIQELEKKFNEEKEKWEQEVSNLKTLQSFKDQLQKARFQVEQAKQSQDYEGASRIQYSVIPDLEKRIKDIDEEWVLLPKHVAQVISRQKNIPLEKILQSKQENILKIAEYLNKEVIGQEQSINIIADQLIASFAGLNFGKRVLGSFLLSGPSGVGKTQTARAIAKYLFDSEEALLRFDLSEFSEKHSVSKLIGAPAGYVGYENGGILTEAIRRQPYSVILFDEVDKAHPDFLDILLQILDAGRLTDSRGRVVDFKNTIIIITTNASDIHSFFKKEVLGRLDAVCRYNTLSGDSLSLIIDQFIKELQASEVFKDKHITLDIRPEVRTYIATAADSPSFGARLLRSTLQQEIVVPLSKKILSGTLGELNDHKIIISLGDNGLEWKTEAKS